MIVQRKALFQALREEIYVDYTQESTEMRKKGFWLHQDRKGDWFVWDEDRVDECGEATKSYSTLSLDTMDTRTQSRKRSHETQDPSSKVKRGFAAPATFSAQHEGTSNEPASSKDRIKLRLRAATMKARHMS